MLLTWTYTTVLVVSTCFWYHQHTKDWVYLFGIISTQKTGCICFWYHQHTKDWVGIINHASLHTLPLLAFISNKESQNKLLQSLTST